MNTTLAGGTIIEVPEGQSLYSVLTAQGTFYVLASSAGEATATLLKRDIGVYGSRKVS